tara:strand:+ start:3088 stop:3519 length:432 start_codon:yes stop_codon:yes gene_type:complete
MGWFNRALLRTCWRVSLAYSLGLTSVVWANPPVGLTAQVNELRIQPSTCVSLHQGQACFVDLTMTWSTASINDYCLYSSAQTSPLKCWKASNQGVLSQQFSATQNLYFYLQQDNSEIVVAESVLNVSWVYKKQQKSRLTWRLF